MKRIILSLVLIVATSTSNAALVSRAGGTMVYDTDLDITWLADANYAFTSGYVFGSTEYNTGEMDWFEAMTWVNQLDFGGFTNWRLPSTSQPDPSCSFHNSYVDAGYDCSNSEMAHLFYSELEGTSASSVPTNNKFNNLQIARYWSGTTVAPSDPDNSWHFNFSDGWQGGQLQEGYINYAWAVHDGDIAAVPLPAAVWLFGSGLLGLIGAAKRKAY